MYLLLFEIYIEQGRFQVLCSFDKYIPAESKAIKQKYITRFKLSLFESYLKFKSLNIQSVLFNKSPLKLMKNAFYLTLKTFFVLKIFKFLSWIFGHVVKTSSLEKFKSLNIQSILFNKSPLKLRKNAFYLTLKTFFVFKIFTFLSWIFGYVVKTSSLERYDYFQNVNVTTWLTNNGNSYIAQYLKKYRQPDNEIWSVSRIQQARYFSSKIMQKMWLGILVLYLLFFLKKL